MEKSQPSAKPEQKRSTIIVRFVEPMELPFDQFDERAVDLGVDLGRLNETVQLFER